MPWWLSQWRLVNCTYYLTIKFLIIWQHEFRDMIVRLHNQNIYVIIKWTNWQNFLLTDAVTKSDDDELRLVKDLFNNYSKEVRPVKNKNASIKVIFAIAYTQLVELVSEPRLKEFWDFFLPQVLQMVIQQAIWKESHRQLKFLLFFFPQCFHHRMKRIKFLSVTCG